MLSFGSFSFELKSLTLRGLQASPAHCKLFPLAFCSSHIGHLSVSWTPSTLPPQGFCTRMLSLLPMIPLPMPSLNIPTPVFILSFSFHISSTRYLPTQDVMLTILFYLKLIALLNLKTFTLQGNFTCQQQWKTNITCHKLQNCKINT